MVWVLLSLGSQATHGCTGKVRMTRKSQDIDKIDYNDYNDD